MWEAKQGREFVTHELDEAIAVQSAIVKTARFFCSREEARKRLKTTPVPLIAAT